MKTLIAYYSRTGTNEKLAGKPIASMLLSGKEFKEGYDEKNKRKGPAFAGPINYLF